MSGESPDFSNFCIKKDIFILKLISSNEIELKTLKQLLEETGETKSSKCLKSYVN